MNEEREKHQDQTRETAAHGAGEGAQTHNVTSDPDAKITIAIGLIGAVVVFALIVALQVVYSIMEDKQVQEKIIAQRPQALVDLRSRQLAKLNSYSWVDRDKQIISIPIERAMQAALEDLNNPGPASALLNAPAAEASPSDAPMETSPANSIPTSPTIITSTPEVNL